MADYLVVMKGQLNAKQRAKLKVGLQAKKLVDVTVDDAVYYFNQMLADMTDVSMANVAIFNCSDVKYPAMFHLCGWDVKLVIEIDAAWLDKMEASCATLSKLAHIKWSYVTIEDQLEEFSEMYASSEQKKDKLNPSIQSLKLIDKFDRHIERLYSKLEQEITSRKLIA